MNKDNTETYLLQWEAIVNAPDQKKALLAHFAYLADSPQYDKLLVEIMDGIDGVSIVDGSLIVSFQMGIELSANKPEEVIPEHFPASFKEKLKRHQFLGVDEYQIILGDQGLFCESDGWFEEMNEWRNICDLNDVISPLTEGPDLWLYHPTEKNSSGEPRLYFRAHDGGDVEDPRDINIGALFLEQLASLLEIDVLDIIAPTNEDELKTWWDGLDAAWKKYFLPESTQEAPSASYIKNLWKETSFHLDKDTNITTLAPLRMFKRIDRLLLDSLAVKDYSPIKDLAALKSLAIVNMPFKDFDGFEHLPRLGSLRLENTGFTHLGTLRPLKKLYSLELNQNPLKSLEGIEGFPELVRLEIDNTQITSISPIKGLKRLNYLHIRHLNLNDYPALATMDELLSIEVDGSPVGDFKAVQQGLSLQKYFEFLTKIDGRNEQGILFPTGNDTICSGEEFISHLQAINFPAKKYADIIHLFANRLLLNALKAKQIDHCTSLIIEIQKLNFKPSPAIFQLYMGNVVVAICMMEPNIELEKPIFEKLNASKITDQRLAFNIACYHAIRKDKAEMLNAIKIAVKLGKPKEQFMNDTDFSIYHKDPDFIKALTEKEENTSNTIKKPWKKN